MTVTIGVVDGKIATLVDGHVLGLSVDLASAYLTRVLPKVGKRVDEVMKDLRSELQNGPSHAIALR